MLSAAWLAGRWLGRHRHTSRWAFFVSFAAGIAWIVALAFMLAAPPYDLPGQSSYTYGYGSSMAIALLAPVAFAAGFGFNQLLAFIASRRARRAIGTGAPSALNPR